MGIVDSYLNYLTLLQAKPDERDAYRQLSKKNMKPVEGKEFDVENYLNDLGKPVVEIAGPTPQGFKTIDTKRLIRFYTSNLAKPGQRAESNPQTGTWKDFVASAGRPDIQADGQQMPLGNESVGGVLISAMLNEKQLNENIIDEANRILISGGILVLEANTAHDVLYALNHGFEPIKWKREIRDFFEPYLNIVLRKK